MAVEQVLYNVVGNNNLAAIGIDDLFHIANEYPYFSPVQFLLALKQKEQSSHSFNYQIQKAALYFSNPMWLQYQLQNESVGEPLLGEVKLNSDYNQAKNKVVAAIIETPISVVAKPTFVDYKSSATVDHKPVVENVLTPFQPSIPADNTKRNDDGIIDYSAYALSNHLAEKTVATVIIEPIKPVAKEQPQYQPTNTFNNIGSSNISFEVPTLEAVRQLLEGKAPAAYIPCDAK